MSFNGSGTFSRIHNWVTDKANSIKITASRMDAEFDGMATGLSNVICRDGQSTVTADIPFNGKKITGLGDATAATDAINRQAGDARWAQVASANTFTGPQTISATAPTLELKETDATADNQRWIARVDSEQFRIQALNDAGSGGGNLIWATRAAQQITGLFVGPLTGAAWFGATSAGITENGTALSAKYTGKSAAETISGAWTFTDHVSVDASKVVEVGTFSTTGASYGQTIGTATGQAARRSSSVPSTSAHEHNAFYNPNGQVGSITTIGTSTSYNTTSDGALKDAVTTADRAATIAKVKAGRPVEFEFKGNPGVKHLGFIAQEMHLVHPEAVTPGDETTPWMMDHSKLVPVLWATVQDLLARVEALENA